MSIVPRIEKEADILPPNSNVELSLIRYLFSEFSHCSIRTQTSDGTYDEDLITSATGK